MTDAIQSTVLYIDMIRTRDFFISSTAFVVFLIVLLFLSFDKKVPTQEVTTSEAIIMTESQDVFSVEYQVTENLYIRRAIFIEKIRNALSNIALSGNTKIKSTEHIPQEIDFQPITPEFSNKSISSSTSTSTLNTKQPSSTNTSSNTSTKKQLLSN